MRHLSVVATFVMLVLGMAAMDAASVSAQTFTYRPAGELVPGSGRGRVDHTVYVPGMRFPLEKGPAFANSQVYGRGGMHGGGGGQCDSQNYSYPWRDNYCETRSWSVPMCPGGKGHQGQDIRPATCKKDVHKAVASVDGTISSISGYVVYLRAADGTNHRYMHMSKVAVKTGQKVKKGQLMGYVSNYMGTTPTTIHLHYDIQRNGQFIPPYMSLVRAYEALMGTNTPPQPPPPPPPPPPTPGGCVPTAAGGAVNSLFKDFPPGQTGYKEAEILYRANITTGCQSSPLMFCPNCKTTRRQMIVFLARAAKLNTSNPPTKATFSDVPVGASGFAEVEAAYRAGITTGCSTGKFCPDNTITRAQAAAMVRRAMKWPQVSPTKARFKDVPTSAAHFRDIETIADRCVTGGCGADSFCPASELTRGQAAVFIARAFNLENINACSVRPNVAAAASAPITEESAQQDSSEDLGPAPGAEAQEPAVNPGGGGSGGGSQNGGSQGASGTQVTSSGSCSMVATAADTDSGKASGMLLLLGMAALVIRRSVAGRSR